MSYPNLPPVAKRGLIGGIFGGIVAGLVATLSNLHRAADIQEVPISPADFPTKSPYPDLIRWTNGDGGDQVLVLDSLSEDGRRMLELGKRAIKDGESQPGNGTITYRDDDEGHAYLFQTNTVPIPEDRCEAAADYNNHNWLRGMLSCFPPYGRQVSMDTTPEREFEYDMDGTRLITVKTHDWMRQFDEKAWAENSPIVHHVKLGVGGNVACWPSGVVYDKEEGFVVRWGYMSTMPVHPLDGRVVWLNAVDIRNRKMAGVFAGAGRHRIRTIDWLNQPIAAFVFGTMFQTWAALLRTPGTGTPSLLCDLPQRRTLLTQIHQGNPRLTACRSLAFGLDGMAWVGGIFRAAALETDIVGEPGSPGPRVEEYHEDL